MVNPSSSTVCFACGSDLAIVQTAVPVQQARSKPSKLTFAKLPLWLRSVIGIFGIYALVVIVLQWQELPSGSVQNNQQQAEHNHTDPSVIDHISQLEKEIAADPKNAELMLQLANALQDAKFFPRAIETYKNYIALNPKNPDAQVDLGICYFEVGNTDAAVKEIESVVRRQPAHQMAMFNLGVIQLSSQNMPEAKKWLKKCVEIDPQSTAGLRAQEILQQH